jgi:hypothetical protein
MGNRRHQQKQMTRHQGQDAAHKSGDEQTSRDRPRKAKPHAVERSNRFKELFHTAPLADTDHSLMRQSILTKEPRKGNFSNLNLKSSILIA